MFPINASGSYFSMLPAHQPNVIDNDKPRYNPLDKNAGDDAELFDPNTQSWQPTQAAGNGRYTNLGEPYREAIDFEIKADNMGGWPHV